MISVFNSTSDVADPCAVPWTLGNPRRPLLVSGRPEAGRGAVPVLARAGHREGGWGADAPATAACSPFSLPASWAARLSVPWCGGHVASGPLCPW